MLLATAMPESVPSTTGHALLGLLSFARMSGYDLARVAAQGLGHVWPISKTQVYAELRRLEELGLVSGRVAGRSGGPEKTLFELTRAGETALDAWAAEDVPETLRLRMPALLKVLVGHRLPPRATRRTLTGVRDVMVARAERLRGLAAVLEGNPDAVYPWATVLFGVRLCEAVAAWAEEVMPRLPRRRLSIDPRRADPQRATAILAASATSMARRRRP
jgi:DNA-binding PadR family transcriptional regulator